MKEEIRLKCGVKVKIDLSKPVKCKACRKLIWWGTTIPNNKPMPIEAINLFDKSLETHFSDCNCPMNKKKKIKTT